MRSRLQFLNDAVSFANCERLNIAIATSSVDALSANALSWVSLRNLYPNLDFTVMQLHPNDSNHEHLEPYSVTPDIQWNVYDVELLAHLYPPLPHEETWFLKPTTTTRIWSEHAIAVHEKYLVLQQASDRWRSYTKPVDIWNFPTQRFRFVKSIAPIPAMACSRCRGLSATGTIWHASVDRGAVLYSCGCGD